MGLAKIRETELALENLGERRVMGHKMNHFTNIISQLLQP